MKNKKGITLIALIITIIVLLILAGVSISLVMGDNGLAPKAQKAKKDTTIEQAKEQMRLAIAAATTDGEGKVFYDNLVTELDNQFGESGYSISGDEDSEEWEISVTTTEGVVTETVQATKVDMIAEIREYFQSLMDTNSEPYLPTYITLSSGIIVENMGYDFEEHVFFLLDTKQEPLWIKTGMEI